MRVLSYAIVALDRFASANCNQSRRNLLQHYSILPNIRVSFDFIMPIYWCSEAASISQFENFLHVNAVDHYTGLGEYLVGVADGVVEGN